MLTAEERAAIRRSWELVRPITDTVADLFYAHLFEIAPHYRPLFKDDLDPQKRKLIAMLAFIVKSLDWADERWQEAVAVEDDLFLVVLALGRRHIELYHVPDEAYGSVEDALMWSLDYGLGEGFTREVRAAWVKAYWLLSKVMQMGYCATGEGSTLKLAGR